MSKIISTASALIFALACATAVPTVAQDTSTHPSIPMRGMSGGNRVMERKSAPAEGADAEFHRSMMTMQHDMDTRLTGDADKDFVAMMIPHHQGAIDMAKMRPLHDRQVSDSMPEMALG
jgi:uncharacterized protein (DUF305 family)